ncbi:MAG: S-layer homology domain-containing protein [Deltaproteobacteria bacterium]
MIKTSKKVIFTVMLLTMSLFLQTMVYAETTLKDIKGSWAEKDIKEMVANKIILGYPDGTFKPDNTVTKLDTLVLASRVLGVDKKENAEEAIAAEEAYKKTLSTYDIYGKKEISFLLNRKIFSQAEMDTYIKGQNAKQNTKRYEAAIIFTKIMGKEKDVKNKTFVILPFMDSQQIPVAAKPYVEFVNDEEIMVGVSKNEFKPNDSLTRAQVAVLLLRVSKKLGTQTTSNSTTAEASFAGTIDYIDTSTMLITVKDAASSKNFTLPLTTPIKVDNTNSTINGLERGFTVTVKTKGTDIVSVDAVSRAFPKTINGIVSSISSTKIGIKDGMDEDADSESYGIDEYVQITKNGNNSSMSALNTGDFGTVYLTSANKIGKIAVEDKDKKVSGKVESLTTDDKVYLTVKVNNESKRYNVSSDVTVSRNGSAAKLKDVKVGDDVSLTIRYNKVIEIKAESQEKTVEGTIEEIVIGKNNTITIKDGTKINTYALSTDAQIRVDNAAAVIYDLRLGAKAEIKLDSNVAVQVKAQKKVEMLEVRGTIKLINLSLGVITIETDSAEKIQIYVDSSSTKVNNVEKAEYVKLSQLEENQKIIAYGKNDRGVFVTSLIVISSEE